MSSNIVRSIFPAFKIAHDITFSVPSIIPPSGVARASWNTFSKSKASSFSSRHGTLLYSKRASPHSLLLKRTTLFNTSSTRSTNTLITTSFMKRRTFRFESNIHTASLSLKTTTLLDPPIRSSKSKTATATAPTTATKFHYTYVRSATTVGTKKNTCEHGQSDSKPDQREIAQTPEISLENAKPMSAIPGPGGLTRIPYIGTLFLFKPFSPFVLETFGHLACHLHDRYGHVFRIRLGKDDTVHTSNIQDIENIFRQEPKFPKRRLMNLSRVYRERNNLPQGLGSCSGEEWYALRKPLNVTLKRPKAVQSYIPALNSVAEDFITRLLEVKCNDINESAEDMFKLFFKYSSEGIGVACFNQRLGFLSHDFDDCPDKKKLLEAFRTSVTCTFREIMGLERRFLKTDKDKFYQTYNAAMNYIREQSLVYVNTVLAEDSGNNKSSNNGERETAATASVGDSNILRTLVRRSDLSRDQVLAIIDSLLIAGTDSTARILTILLYDMALNPEVQTRVARDVRALAGPDGPVTSECIDRVPILRACVKESMRIHYPVSSGTERILTRDMVISGYHVPEGTSVFMTGARTSMDPRYFPNPSQFLPDRWMRTQAQTYSSSSTSTRNVAAEAKKEAAHGGSCPITNPPSPSSDSDSQTTFSGAPVAANARSAFAFIPFGHGARSCIGSRFAETELVVGLAKVLQALEVSVHPSYKTLEVRYTPFITPQKPVPFVFSRRESDSGI